MKLRTSSFVTLPSFPLLGMSLMFKLCFFAMCLTAGVANALELPGGAVASLSTCLAALKV